MSDVREQIPAEALERKHEQRDLSTRGLFWGLFALVVLMVVSVWAMTLLFGVLDDRAAARDPEPSPLVERGVTPPQPRLETDPGQLLRRLRALEQVQLGGYAWLDRDNGIARIPVDRAMQILVQQGLPHRESADGMRAGGER